MVHVAVFQCLIVSSRCNSDQSMDNTESLHIIFETVSNNPTIEVTAVFRTLSNIFERTILRKVENKYFRKKAPPLRGSQLRLWSWLDFRLFSKSFKIFLIKILLKNNHFWKVKELIDLKAELNLCRMFPISTFNEFHLCAWGFFNRIKLECAVIFIKYNG